MEPLLKILSENIKPFKDLLEHMNPITSFMEKLNQQSFFHQFEPPEQQLNFIQNFTKIQKIGEIKEKAIWRYGDKIELNKNEFEELDSKDTFTSVKIALTNPRIKDILLKKLKFSDIDDDNVYKLIKLLPKVDLHCHLGGCARINDLKEIAKTYPEDKALYENIKVFFTKNKDLNLDIFFTQTPEVIVKEIFSLKDNDEFKSDYFASIIKYLEKNKCLDKLSCIYKKESESGEFKMLLDDDKPNFHFFGVGLKSYLKFGDWGGSTLLQKESALKKGIECLCSFAKEHNVRYLELRFNPLGYTKNGLTGKEVYQIIREAVIKYCDGIIINFIFISGKPIQDTPTEKISFKLKLLEIIKLYIEIYEEQEEIDFNKRTLLYPKLVGFDFAGLEDYFHSNINYGYRNIIENTRDELKELVEREIYITIHCGETKSALNLSKKEIELWNKSVSDAIHILNARRLGHALNINDLTLLKSLAKFNTTIELCPSSNCQISHFSRTPWIFSKNNQDKLRYINKNEFIEYPLRKYLNENLKVCINTDDPGISKTDWTREIFIASELCEDNLSIEQIIELIYNGIEGSFLSVPDQKKLKYLFSEEIGNLLNAL